MKFGRLADVSETDFSLPSIESALLGWESESSASDAPLELYVGAPVWAHKSFYGKIYPKKLPASECLSIYARNFNCIELNSTFYGVPPLERIAKWCEQVGPDFRFCPKVPKSISHSTGALPRGEMMSFFRAAESFGDKLGMTFFQFSPELGPRQWRRFRALLEQIPRGFEAAVELRNPEWFASRKALEWLLTLGVETGVRFVISDTAGRRDVLHYCFPHPQAFVRFSGDGLVPSDFSRLDVWSEVLRQLSSRGLQRCYFFLHQEEEGNCVELAERLGQLLPETSLPAIERVRETEQLALF